MADRANFTNHEIAKFWDRLKIEYGCWEWQAGKFQRGYGAFAYQGKNPGYAHRFSYELHYGEVPEGEVVMHICDNRACVNPTHLRAAPQKENIHDSMRKGRWMSPARREYLTRGRERAPDGKWL